MVNTNRTGGISMVVLHT